MALADIIARIGSDAQVNADAIVTSAQQRADEAIAGARAQAQRQSQITLATAAASAQRSAETVVVKARLAARDAHVTAQRELIDEALVATADAVRALPDDRYVTWLAGRVAAVARGGETLSVGSEDLERLDAIVRALADTAPHIKLATSRTPAPFARGALLSGDRVSVDLSVDTIVTDQRDTLELTISQVLFAKEGSDRP